MTKNRGSGGVTIKDVAARIGLAHSTVSRALNDHPGIGEETKVIVRRAAADLNYVANSGARLMRSGTSHVVGLIVPDIENDFYNSATRIMAEFYDAEHLQLLLAVSEDDPEKERKQVLAFREARVAGIVIAATLNPKRETAQMLRQLPTVQFLRRHASIRSPSIRADDSLGLRIATDHLVGLGHTRIGFVGVHRELSTGKDRLDGYRQSLAAAGIVEVPQYVRTGSPQPSSAREALIDLLALAAPPSAIVVASPRLVLGALDVISQQNIAVPEALSLVAYSDVEWFRTWRPSITAVALPTAAMATTAASLLSGTIRKPDENDIEFGAPFEPTLLVRASTAPAQHAGATGEAMTTVLVTDYAWPDLEIERSVIEAAGFKLVSGRAEALPADKIAALAAQHRPTAIMTCWAEVNAAAIEACPSLAIVARIGVGLDDIDRVAADRRGAVVTNVPDYCVEEVSDHAIGFLLAFARRLVTFDREVKQGRWEPGTARLMRVREMTVGIAGYGRIGRRTAEKLAAFGVELLVTDAVRPAKPMQGIEFVELESLARRSDAVIIHLPLTPDTRHMFDAPLLRQMKRDAILINVSRGPLVDSEALVAALDEGLIAGAALDVVEGEPNNVPRKLVDHPRVIATPHVAFSSTASLLELRRRATEEVVRVLKGEKPHHPCPPPAAA